MSGVQEAVKSVARYWLSTFALASVFVLGLSLLFFRDLDQSLRSYLVPGLVVYVLGNFLLAHFHLILGKRNEAKHARECEANPQHTRACPPLRWWAAGLVCIAYFAWLGALVAYLVSKKIL